MDNDYIFGSNMTEEQIEQTAQNMAKKAGSVGPSPHSLDSLKDLLLETISVFKGENVRLNRRVYELENKISKLVRPFEALFQEELNSRINGKSKSGMDSACVMEDPFWKLDKKVQEIK